MFTKIVWPSGTRNGEQRTREKIISVIEEIENDANHNTIMGIQQRSLLLELPGFDYVNSIPAEYMHSVAIGLVKKLIELCFKVGETRPRQTKRRLYVPSAFNSEILTIKVPREFSRRCRKMDFSVLKAQEMRNILIFSFLLF